MPTRNPMRPSSATTRNTPKSPKVAAKPSAMPTARPMTLGRMEFSSGSGRGRRRIVRGRVVDDVKVVDGEVYAVSGQHRVDGGVDLPGDLAHGGPVPAHHVD